MLLMKIYPMKKFTSLFLLILLFTNCDDGNIDTVQLNFEEQALQQCGEYVFYVLTTDRTESLVVSVSSTTNVLTNTAGSPQNFTINNTSNRVVYRLFGAPVTGASYFCSSIPPTEPQVLEEWTAPSGIVEISVALEEDDNDNVDADIEQINRDNLEMSPDTDGDGLPDYKDSDDNGDNVPTSVEARKNQDGTFVDTDEDGVADYLDDDDDGDGIPTRNEVDAVDDTDPTNNFVNVNGVNVARYLLADETTSVPVETYREHSFRQTFVNTIRIVGNFTLVNGNQEVKFDVEQYDFGSYNFAGNTITTTPAFNN